jgi:hypothetical protein
MYELFKAALPWIPPVLHRIRPSSRHQLPHPAASLLGAPFLRPPASRAAPRVAARVGKQEAAAIGEGGEETRIGRGGERRAGDWERVMIWDWGVIFDLGSVEATLLLQATTAAVPIRRRAPMVIPAGPPARRHPPLRCRPPAPARVRHSSDARRGEAEIGGKRRDGIGGKRGDAGIGRPRDLGFHCHTRVEKEGDLGELL